jgi:hypothetical protein
MWRLAALALLLCAGCENTAFFGLGTRDWFSNQAEEKARQAGYEPGFAPPLENPPPAR